MPDGPAAAAGGSLEALARFAEVRSAPAGDLVEVDRARLRVLLDEEAEQFRRTHRRSAELAERAARSLLGGVPMSWMAEWASPYPVFVERARDARIVDVDGNEYVDFCLGDTGAMTGHGPAGSLPAIAAQLERGLTTMLPTEDALWVGEELQRRFGLARWQFTTSATDANRFVIRFCRQITRRPKVLVFDYCYHGTVDETFATLDGGRVRARDGNVGPPVDPAVTTKVVQFNDVDALEEALAPGDVACVLAEPALTNIGIVLPDEGFHDALREVTRRTGTLLVIDETHTISTSASGYTGAYGLEPDVLTIGKAIASGIPMGAYGLSEEVAARIEAEEDADYEDVGGVGGTLAGNALQLAAARATLERVLTHEVFEHTVALAERYTDGVARAIAETRLPWHIARLGCRAEYMFCPAPPKDGAEAARAGHDDGLKAYMHLSTLNRGVLVTPFHNMALVAPQATEEDVDLHTDVFRRAAVSLVEGT
jgi:glutamate-1-semialdehyde 2,1-aminomutase